jgi:hypothetical protein
LIDHGYNLFYLLTVFDEPQRYQWVFKLVNTDSSRTVIVKGVEVASQLTQFFIVEVDAMLLSMLLQPLPQHALRVKL